MRLLIGVIAFIALIAGGFFLLNSNSNTEIEGNSVDEISNSNNENIDLGNENPERHVIEFTSDGFSPSSLTIANGDTVVFVNNAEIGTWPASNAHPSHGQYGQNTGACPGSGSDFDSCGSVAPGDEWEFTFTENGNWGYHDHLDPRKTGIIIVQ